MRLALLLLVVGCVHPYQAFEARDALRFDPPPVFASWWTTLGTCAGRSGDLARIEWYVVPAGRLLLDGQARSGVWGPPHRIYVTDVVLAYLDRYAPVIWHEMLHDYGVPHGPAMALCERAPA